MPSPPVTQCHPGHAGLAQRQRGLGRGDLRQPIELEGGREFPHKRFLVDHPGIENIVNRRTLALRCRLKHALQRFKVLATRTSCGFEQKFNHRLAVLCE